MNRPALLSLEKLTLSRGPLRMGPVSLCLNAGETVAILGPSGAGKSTLLGLMAGDLNPDTGTIALGGRALGQWPLASLAQHRAVLPQTAAPAFGLPVDMVVGLGRVARQHDPHRAQIVADALKAAQAHHLLARSSDTLSGGELARVHLARVMAQLWDCTGGLLLVDEPTTSLDPALQISVFDTLRAFTRERGHALVAVLHDVNLALQQCGRLWLVKQGRLVADMSSDSTAVTALEDLYGLSFEVLRTRQGELCLHARPIPSGLDATQPCLQVA
jgi:iron complex transport system ATP-binding protein